MNEPRLHPAHDPLAANAHEAWSGWMKYLFDCSTRNEDGTYTIPLWAVERWTRQMNTPYAELPEAEKESDRVEADKIMAVLERAHLRAIRQKLEAKP